MATADGIPRLGSDTPPPHGHLGRPAGIARLPGLGEGVSGFLFLNASLAGPEPPCTTTPDPWALECVRLGRSLPPHPPPREPTVRTAPPRGWELHTPAAGACLGCCSLLRASVSVEGFICVPRPPGNGGFPLGGGELEMRGDGGQTLPQGSAQLPACRGVFPGRVWGEPWGWEQAAEDGTCRPGRSGAVCSPARPPLPPAGPGKWASPSSARRGREPALLWESAPPTPAGVSHSAKPRLREDVGGAASVLAAVAGQDPPPHRPLVLPLAAHSQGAGPPPHPPPPAPVEVMATVSEASPSQGDQSPGRCCGLPRQLRVISPAAACEPPSPAPTQGLAPSQRPALAGRAGGHKGMQGRRQCLEWLEYKLLRDTDLGPYCCVTSGRCLNLSVPASPSVTQEQQQQ